MGKVIYSATMSLHGYIAGPDGDMSWLAPYLGPNPQVDALQRDIGALLIGGRTFRRRPESWYRERGRIQRNLPARPSS